MYDSTTQQVQEANQEMVKKAILARPEDEAIIRENSEIEMQMIGICMKS